MTASNRLSVQIERVVVRLIAMVVASNKEMDGVEYQEQFWPMLIW